MQYETGEFSDLIVGYSAHITGRQWLVGRVKARLDDSDYRFIVLTGEPGVGKTAFLAHLAGTRPDWPCYFIRRDSYQIFVPGDATTFLLSIGGQLAALRPELFRSDNVQIVAHQRVGTLDAGAEAVAARIGELWASPFHTAIVHADQEILRAAGKAVAVEIGRLMGDARLRSMQDLQQLALIEPCRVLARVDPRARIVVLVDALDEIRYSPAERNVAQALAEFPVVPPNLRFIVSSRPGAEIGRLLMRRDVCVLPLDAASADNMRDLHDYAKHALSNDVLLAALTREKLTPETFRLELLAKAAGNFLYLKSVLNAIQDALADSAKADRLPSLLRVAELPSDLGKLYAYFLSSAERWAREGGFSAGAWRSYLSPLLGILAAAQAPLSASQLVAFTSLGVDDVRNLLRELRQFVVRSEDADEFYRIYHATFADYLLDSQRNHDYWVDGRKAHARIAEHYLGRWGGLETGLPGLDQLEKGMDSEYGLRHLAIHLDQAGLPDGLCRLLIGSPAWMETKFEHLNGDASYVSDLGVATRRFADPLTQAEVVALVQLHAARHVVNQRVSIFSDTDLELLVLLGREAEALGQIRLRPSSKERLAGLLLVYNALRQQRRPLMALLDEGLEVLEAIDDVRERVHASAAIAVAMMESGRAEEADVLFVRAKHEALAIEYDSWRWAALSEVANAHTKIGEFSEATDITREIADPGARIEGLQAVAGALEAAGMFAEMREIYAEIARTLRQTMRKGAQHIDDLSGLFYALLQARQFEEANATVLDMANEASAEVSWQEKARARRVQARALRALAVALSAAGRTTEADEAFAAAYRVGQQQDTYDEASGLCDLIMKLAETGRDTWATQMLEEAGEIARSVRGWLATEGRYAHGSAIGWWIHALLATGDLDRAKEVVEEGGEVDTAARNIRTVCLALAKAGRAEEARILAERSTEYYGYRETTLYELAEYLATSGQFDAARKVVQENPYRDSRRRSLRDLACALTRTGDFAGALATIEPIRQPEDRASVLRVVIEGMARSGQIAEAAKIFAELEDTVYRLQDPIAFGKALRSVGLVFDAVRMSEPADMAFVEVQDAARRVEEFFSRIKQLRDLAIVLTRTGRLASVREVERAIREKDPSERAPLDQVDERDLISVNDSRAEALRTVAEALADEGQFADAEEVALRINESSLAYYCDVCEEECTRTLRHLFVALAKRGYLEDARRIYGEAAAIAKIRAERSYDRKMQDELIAAWSQALAMAGQFKSVRATVRK